MADSFTAFATDSPMNGQLPSAISGADSYPDHCEADVKATSDHCRVHWEGGCRKPVLSEIHLGIWMMVRNYRLIGKLSWNISFLWFDYWQTSVHGCICWFVVATRYSDSWCMSGVLCLKHYGKGSSSGRTLIVLLGCAPVVRVEFTGTSASTKHAQLHNDFMVWVADETIPYKML